MRLLLYTTEPVLAKGVEAVLMPEPGFELVALCQDPDQLAAAAESAAAGIILLDWKAPLAIRNLSDLRRGLRDAKILLWTELAHSGVVSQAIQNGVCGVLQKAIPPETLLRCLRIIADGGVWFDQNLVAGCLQGNPARLTARETELLDLLSQGLKNKEIAYLLRLTEGSVKVYLSRIFKKLGVSDRFEAALQTLNHRGGRTLSCPARLEIASLEPEPGPGEATEYSQERSAWQCASGCREPRFG